MRRCSGTARGLALLVLTSCNALTGADGYRIRAESGSDAGDGGTTPGDHVVFVTSTTTAPNFGPDGEGADRKCAEVAQTAGLAGTFVALVTRSAEGKPDLRARLGAIRGFVRVDGVYLADTVDELLSGQLRVPIAMDENRLPLSSFDLVFTGMRPGGARSVDCNGWTTIDASASVVQGDPHAGLAAAIDTYAGMHDQCTVRAHLYCARVDGTDREPPPRTPGRVIFVTRTAYDAKEGARADEVCRAEATSPLLVGKTFRALLARPGTRPDGALSATATYVWPNGARVGTGSDLVAGKNEMGIWQDGAGAWSKAGVYDVVWIGAPALDQPGTAELTCDGWTAQTATAPAVGEPTSTGASSFVHPFVNTPGDEPTFPCSMNARFYCVEQGS